MISRVWQLVLAVFFTFALPVLVVKPIHGAVTCSASASAGRTSASGSVSPGISDLEYDHEVNDKYEGLATVSLTVDGISSGKRGDRIWIKVKERTRERSSIVKKTVELAAGAEILVPGRVISVVKADGKQIVTYEYHEKIIDYPLYTISDGCSDSASGDPWDYKDAYAYGNCGSAADADGLKTYTPSGIFGLGIGPF